MDRRHPHVYFDGDRWRPEEQDQIAGVLLELERTSYRDDPFLPEVGAPWLCVCLHEDGHSLYIASRQSLQPVISAESAPHLIAKLRRLGPHATA